MASVGKGDQVAHLRPTSDRVRESIFNLLQNGGYGDPVKGACALDVFAGTGALGLEALSRGAEHVEFLDDGCVAQGLIKQNIDLCSAHTNTRLIRKNATRPGASNDRFFDLIFLDPPYGKQLGQKALVALLSNGWIDSDALIVWEENAEHASPEGFYLKDARRYGDTWIHVLTVRQ